MTALEKQIIPVGDPSLCGVEESMDFSCKSRS